MWYVHTCVMKWLKPKGIFLALIGQSGGRWCVVLGEIIHTGVLRFSVIWSRGIRLILDAWPLTMCAQAEVVRAGSLTHSPADFVYIWRIKRDITQTACQSSNAPPSVAFPNWTLKSLEISAQWRHERRLKSQTLTLSYVQNCSLI